MPKVATSPLFVKDSKQVTLLQCAAAVWYSFSITHHSITMERFLSFFLFALLILLLTIGKKINVLCLSGGFLFSSTGMWRGRFGPATFTLLINHCCLLTGKAVSCTMKCGWWNTIGDKGFVFSNKWRERHNRLGLMKHFDDRNCGKDSRCTK